MLVLSTSIIPYFLPYIGEYTGTPFFNAPEVVLQGKHTFALDIYSIGCILHQMITGREVNLTGSFTASPMPDDFFNDFNGSREAEDMLRKTLTYYPERRIKLDDLMKHVFFRQEYCPRILPETVFDEQPSRAELETLDQQLQEEEVAAREMDRNATLKRSRKGKEVDRGRGEAQLNIPDDEDAAAQQYHIKRRKIRMLVENLEEKNMLKEKFGETIDLESSSDKDGSSSSDEGGS
ncbi:hypothetical protein BGX23_006658 [Mortierella sp. AD031]|nr:hypothetical protein BGX23_006658 [Mortierella sp. AD031]